MEQAFKALVKEALANSQFETKCVFVPFATSCSACTIILTPVAPSLIPHHAIRLFDDTIRLTVPSPEDSKKSCSC